MCRSTFIGDGGARYRAGKSLTVEAVVAHTVEGVVQRAAGELAKTQKTGRLQAGHKGSICRCDIDAEDHSSVWHSAKNVGHSALMWMCREASQYSRAYVPTQYARWWEERTASGSVPVRSNRGLATGMRNLPSFWSRCDRWDVGDA